MMLDRTACIIVPNMKVDVVIRLYIVTLYDLIVRESSAIIVYA